VVYNIFWNDPLTRTPKLDSLPPLRVIAWLAGAGASYFLVVVAGLFYPGSGKIIGGVWPAGGLGLALLLLVPSQLKFSILAILFLVGELAHVILGWPFVLSCGFMLTNIAESFICSVLIRKICKGEPHFDRILQVGALLVAALLVNACTAVCAASLASFVTKGDFWLYWVTWWVSNGLGILCITPLVVGLLQCRTFKFRHDKWYYAELAMLFFIWIVVALAIFNNDFFGASPSVTPYMLFGLTCWMAVRKGTATIVIALPLLVIIALSGSAVHSGPTVLGGGTETNRVLIVQVFLMSISITGLLLAASVSQTKAAEQRAREGQLSLKAIADNLPDGMVFQQVFYPDGRKQFVFVSSAVERLNGVSLNDVLSDPSHLYNLLHEEDKSRFLDAESKTNRDLSVFRETVRLRLHDGSIHWMRICAAPRKRLDGCIVWDGLQLEVTNQIRALDDLRNSELRYRALVDNASDGIFVADKAGNYLDANVSACRMVGYSLDELRKLNMCELVDASNLFVDPMNLEQLREANSMVKVRIFKRKNGTTFKGIISATAIPDGRLLGILRDATEEPVIRQALRKSEEKYRMLVDTMQEGLEVSDKDGRITFMNQQACRMTGYELNEVVGKAELMFFTGGNARIYRQISEFQSSPMRLPFEIDWTRKDGSAMETLVTPASIFDEHGTYQGTVIVFTDIGERKRNEAIMGRWANLFRFSRWGVMITSPDGTKVELANPAFAESRQQTLEEIYATPVIELYAPSVRDEVSERIWLTSETGHQAYESIHVRKDGSEFPVFIDATTVKDPEGQILYRIENAQDISDLQNVSQRLKVSEELFTKAFYTNPAAIILSELESGKLVEVNEGFEKMTGYTREEVLGKTVLDFGMIYPEPRAAISAQVKAHGTAKSVELSYWNKKGEQGVLVISAELVTIDAKDYMLSCSIDISERKKAERAVQASLDEKEILLRELYHRTKNNMQMIMALLGLQRHSLHDSALQSAFLDAEGRIRSMALVHQQLYEAKDLSHVNMHHYLTALTTLLTESFHINPEKISLQLSLQDVEVLIDTAIPCGLILNELVTNSLKYGFPGDRTGTISISVARSEDGQITLKVSDNGVGWAADFDLKRDSGLGLQNVVLLGERQLRGTVTFRNDHGLECTLVFRDEGYHPRV